MQSTPQQYMDQLPDERKKPIKELRRIILKNLPEGFVEVMNYGMIGYVVPHTIYPKGYHVNPNLPLPFINLASQKNYIAFYHMMMHSDPALMKWFNTEYRRTCNAKPDMGKSCIRFKKVEHIPYDLIAELVRKVDVNEWVRIYENQLKAGRKNRTGSHKKRDCPSGQSLFVINLKEY